MAVVHVNPSHVKKSKEFDDNNPSKNDRKDPKTIAGLVTEGRYMFPYMPEGIYASIRDLNNMRMRTTESVVIVKNRLARWFSIYFPEFKAVFGDLKAKSARLLLTEAPLPEDVVKLGVEGVNQIFRNAKLRSVGMKKALQIVEAAKHSIGRKESPWAAREEISELLEDLDRYLAREEKLMTRLHEEVMKVPNVERILEIKGIGIRTAAGFIAEVGEIRRFEDAKSIQKLSGYAIVADESGKHNGQSSISYRGRKILRYFLFHAAISVIGKNPEFAAIHEYYTTRKKNPLKKMQSVIAVACKLIRVFYTILTKGVRYDGQKMLNDIVRPEAIA
jgi:transposase